MEIINKILKKDEINLLKCNSVKQCIKNDSILISRYQLSLKVNQEDDFFYFQCLTQTLKNKEMLEGCFVRSFDDMYDYWQSLNYNERKHLINRDMEQVTKNLKYVLKNSHRYYVPCMNDKINEIYESEMVLFGLKQYNRLRFDCKDMIDKKSITLEMIQAGFTSLNYLIGDADDFWTYCDINHTLYSFRFQHVQHKIPFVRYEGDGSDLIEWIQAFKEEKEDECVRIMLDHHYLSEKMERKCLKMIERRKK